MITGLSPQVITETIYAHFVQHKLDDTVPTEVHLITTKEGAERAELLLLAPNTGHFRNLIYEYTINNVTFGHENIHTLKDADGNELDDISTPEENSNAADYICSFIQSITSHDGIELFVSLAGGRKTMGYYAGYALSLFGRHQDTLTHVLVSPEYENNPQFFYPTKTRHIIYTRDEKPLDASKAHISLSEIPFVRLRSELPASSLISSLPFQEAVTLINNATNSAILLKVDITNKKIDIQGQKVEFELGDFLFYLWFLQRCINDKPAIAKPHEYEPNKEYASDYLAMINQDDLEMIINNRTLSTLEHGMEEGFFASKRSRINSLLNNSLGQSLANKIKIQTLGKRGYSLYAVDLKSENILVKV